MTKEQEQKFRELFELFIDLKKQTPFTEEFVYSATKCHEYIAELDDPIYLPIMDMILEVTSPVFDAMGLNGKKEEDPPTILN